MQPAIILILLLSLNSCFEIKSKQMDSSMDFLNNFFSDDAPKAVEKAKPFNFKEKTVNSTLKAENNQETPTENIAVLKQNSFMISSPSFKSTSRFPPVKVNSGRVLYIDTDQENFRINHAKKDTTSKNTMSDKYFVFRLSGLNLYYSATETDLNILGSISISDVSDVFKRKPEKRSDSDSTIFCFILHDDDHLEWKLCSDQENIPLEWVCKINELLKKTDKNCPKNPKLDINNSEKSEFIVKNVTQPLLIIPLPSPHCNQDWNYQQNGVDWECDCAEGKTQSPIDLPSIKEALDTPVRPFFAYEDTPYISQTTTLEGQLQENTPVRLQLIDNTLKIIHTNLGKLITMDGAVYFAQEIVIHSPAEHKIKGKIYEMEIQIIHYGQSKGDIAKQVILCFVFEKTPGVYNKFIDDLDMFDLPSPINKSVDLKANIFIPKILFNSDSEDTVSMKQFSFYTYQGSITAPPCTENTIIYVGSKPLPLGNTAIQLFQETLRVPDMINENSDVLVTDWIPQSNRKVQPLNGRPVFHYDHEKYCGPEFLKLKDNDKGHYEKVMKEVTNYFYVSGKKVSGVPNAFVVSKEEASGKFKET